VDLSDELRLLVSRADALTSAIAALAAGPEPNEPERQRFADGQRRLQRSVLRPLRAAIARLSGDSVAAGGGEAVPTPPAAASVASVDDGVWELARAATMLRVRYEHPTEIQEAAAALQDLTLALVAAGTDGQTASARLAELRQLQASLPLGIQSQADGPYLATNVELVLDWLGVRIPSRPQMALCRCGASARKPFCDGTHAEIAFSGAKDPARVPDRLDEYAGQQVTVLDNRGTCAHSGFCTDGLPSVFHVGREPFVSPSGARMDDIIAAVRACPSGALGHSRDGHRAPDPERPAAVEVSKDGPYRVTGGIPLRDGAGQPEAQNRGASPEHYSLCRCGHSQNKPFCSGRHWQVQFRDPHPSPEHQPTLFEWAGGFPALLRMTRIFYSKHVPEDPLIGPLFASMSPDHPERVAAWLGEVFGGPKQYSETYGGYPRMLSRHVGKGLTEAQRARWVSLLARSADEARLPADPEFRAAFVAYLEWGSRLALENSQPGARPPPQMPMPRWWWVCDATPGSRISALAAAADVDAPPVTLPSPTEAPSFARHIKPLFRQMDRQSMTFAFDLWSYDDVVRHADGILRRLEAGTMPCDGAWPKTEVDVFRRWVDAGTPA